MNDLPKILPHDVNFTRRVPVCLIIDTSGSMEPSREALQEAVEKLIAELKNDSIAAKSAELAIIAFGNDRANVLREYTTVREMSSAPKIECDGSTPLGEALDTALRLMRERQTEYTKQGIPTYKPLVILLSDGQPTDDWSSPALRFTKEAQARKWNVLALAYGDADVQVLGTITKNVLKATKSFSFADFFRWISSSVASVSRSSDGSTVNLELPKGVIQLQI